MIENLKKLEITVLEFYKKIETDIKNIKLTATNLTDMHQRLIDKTDNINELDSFDLYVDNIYFYKSVIEHLEYHICTIKNMSFRKLYGDLFKLYVRLTKKIHSYENIITNAPKSNYIQKYFVEPKIKKFDILIITNKYYYEDLENILKNFDKMFEFMKTTINSINSEIESKTKEDIDGYIANTHIIGLNSIKSKLNVQMVTFIKLTSVLLEKHGKFLSSFANYSNIIINDLKKNFQKEIIIDETEL